MVQMIMADFKQPDQVNPGNLTSGSDTSTESVVLSELERLRAGLIDNLALDKNPQPRTKPGNSPAALRRHVQYSVQKRGKPSPEVENDIDRLVRNLQDMSRPEVYYLKLEKTLCRLNDFLQSLTPEIEAIASRHQLIIQIPDRLPAVEIDQKLIRQIILHLVQNAVQFSKEDSPIILEVKGARNQVKFTLTDYGVGIPSRLKDKLFEYRCDEKDTISARMKGNDSCLPICRDIIEAHGGMIRVTSRPGSGSRFSFTLPAGAQSKLI